MLFLSLLASLAAVTRADPQSSTSCSSSTLSCTSSSRGLNSCCSPTYGNLVMEMQWIPGYGPDNAFTMHGLWPNMCSGAEGPKNGCDENRQYTDISSYFDSSLLNQMNTYWPSDQGGNNDFWMHEWQKHGTCVSTLAPNCFDSSSYNTGDEVALYFGKALELRQTYDIYAAMNNAGYAPVDSASNGYNVDDVVSAIKRAYGVTVQLECKGSAIDGVRMWFNVRGVDNYVPINAPSSKQKCRGTIYLPTKNSGDNNSRNKATAEGSSDSSSSGSGSSSSSGTPRRRRHPKRNHH